MRRHGYGLAAGSVLLTAFLIATLAGCAGDAAPSADPAPSGGATPGATASATATVAPSPTVALREPHSLVFSATGTAAVTSVTFELDDHKATRRSVSLPWRETVDVPADGKLHRWSLTMKHRSGRVELVAIFDGAVTGQTRGRTSGTGTASVGGSVRG
jgi:hypothetical protein